MTFEYRNPTTGDRLAAVELDGDVWLKTTSKGCLLPPDRVEEVIAGIRDAARTASGQQPAAVEETHIVADDSDDPEHIDDCPGCEAFSLTGHVAGPAVGQPAEAQATDYDRDPEAIAWARRKIQDEIDRCRKFHTSATEAGKPEQAEMWQRLANRMQRTFMGGSGCVIAYFDERLPAHRMAEEARS